MQCGTGAKALLAAPGNNGSHGVRTSWTGTYHELDGGGEEYRYAAWKWDDRHRVSIQQARVHRISGVGRIRPSGSRTMCLPTISGKRFAWSQVRTSQPAFLRQPVKTFLVLLDLDRQNFPGQRPHCVVTDHSLGNILVSGRTRMARILMIPAGVRSRGRYGYPVHAPQQQNHAVVASVQTVSLLRWVEAIPFGILSMTRGIR